MISVENSQGPRGDQDEVVIGPQAQATAGYARIKPEFVVAQKNTDAGQPKANNGENDMRQEKKRGMDRQREKKMAKAREEVRHHTVRLCPSLVHEDGRACKFGDKCTAEHSAKEYWAQKPPDLGPSCIHFDQIGRCPFSVACCFARSHTNSDFSQQTKEPNPKWQPVINANTVHLQQKLRKRTYDFSKSDQALLEVESSVGSAFEREAPKLNLKSFAGKKYLAPLTTVGNLPFRRLCVELGADITCGEMAMATNILQGFPSELTLLKRHHTEKIFGVQLAGGYPDSLGRAVQFITQDFDVDFIDLNLGCPLDAVNEKGGGCCLAQKSGKLVKVLQNMQKIAGDTPVTMKMRYGAREGQRTAHMLIRTVAERCPPQLLSLHPRSREQRYSKAAEWDYVSECANAIDGRFPFFVCGDVLNYEDYYERLETYPIDGIMIGRGALIKPWIFTEIDERRHWDISSSERFDLIRKFVNYGLEHWGSDLIGVESTRRFLLEWLSFQHRYIPVGLLEEPPQRINQRPPSYRGRDELETLLSSPAASDWVKISEMLLGKVPQGFLFVPKHKASSY